MGCPINRGIRQAEQGLVNEVTTVPLSSVVSQGLFLGYTEVCISNTNLIQSYMSFN